MAIVLASKATATLPPESYSAIMPEPTTVANNIAVPKPSATVRRTKFALFDNAFLAIVMFL